MFDIGFWELAVIGVIALLVIGPERLPGVARNVGLWVGRIRRYVAHVRRDIERELHAEEVRQLLEKPGELDELRDVARETASALEDARRGLDDAARKGREDDAGKSAPAGGGAAPDKTSRRVPHHAVDEDPFAPASLAGVSPEAQAQGVAHGTGGDVKQDAAPGTDETAAPDDTTADDEKQPERQGQR